MFSLMLTHSDGRITRTHAGHTSKTQLWELFWSLVHHVWDLTYGLRITRVVGFEQMTEAVCSVSHVGFF